MAPLAHQLEQKWTYADYLTWTDDQRWEIIDGEAYAMTPAPLIRHQRISMNISSVMAFFFRGKPCIPFYAPTDVVFDDFNVVQPDLIVVCEESKISEKCIEGAPDVVIEILSPSTNLRDRRNKKALYERFGVKEYLIVDPISETVERFLLVDGRYGGSEIFNWDEPLTFNLFPELTLNLWEVFEKELPEGQRRGQTSI